MPRLSCECGAQLMAPDQLAGKLVRCPKCTGLVQVPADIDLLPEPAAFPGSTSEPMIPAPARRATIQPPAVTVPAWKLHGRWALGLALLPLLFSVFSKNDVKERFEKMIESDPKLAVQIVQLEKKKDAKEGDMFALFPGHRITGAFVGHDSKIHWLLALVSATAFWGFLLLVYPMGNASHQALWGVGLFTGTVGILLLLALQFAGEFSQGMNLTGRGLLVVIFYIIKLIGFSYRAALDPENGFILSMLGFTFGVGFCEEVCKLIPLLWHYKRTAKLDLSGTVVWGLASGIGFGVSEGITYSSDYYNGIQTGGIYLVRFVSCVALHAIWNGFSAVLLWKWQTDLDAIEHWWGWVIPLFKIAGVSMLLHALYDTSLKREYELLGLLTAIISFVAFFWLYERVKRDKPSLAGPRLV